MIFLVTFNDIGRLQFLQSVNSWGYFWKHRELTAPIQICAMQQDEVGGYSIEYIGELSSKDMQRLRKCDHLSGEPPELKAVLFNPDVHEWLDEEPRLRKRRPW